MVRVHGNADDGTYALDHGRRVLALILHGRKAVALRYARQHLKPGYFPDQMQGDLFLIACRFADQTGGGLLTREALLDAVGSGATPGRVALWAEYFDSLADSLPGEADGAAALIHSVDRLVDSHFERATGDILAQTMEILTRGAQDGPRTIRGHADARVYALGRLREVDAEARGEDDTSAVALPAVPAYPTAAITGPLRDFIQSSPKLPDALLGGAGLAALSAVIPKAKIELPGGSVERPALWVALIAPTGGAKTPSLASRAMPPLYELNAEAAKLPRDDTDPRILVQDMTIEALARHLNRSATSSALVAMDELDAFLSGIGQYKKVSGDRARWLALWPCTAWEYQRVGQAKGDGNAVDISIPNPVVTIVGGLQPAVQHLLGDTATGFRARWLPHLSMTMSPDWDSWSADGRAQWHEVIRLLWHSRDVERTWYLAGKAEELWRSAGERWKETARTEPNGSAKAALAKADLYAARIALVIAESTRTAPPPGERREDVLPPSPAFPSAPEWLTPKMLSVLTLMLQTDSEGEAEGAFRGARRMARAVRQSPEPDEQARELIGASHMESAIAIVDYAVDCWRALGGEDHFNLTYRDRELNKRVDVLRDWLEARPDRRATKREIMRGAVAGVRSAENLRTLIEAYEKVYPGTVREEHTGGRGPAGVMVYAPPRDAPRPYTPTSTEDETVSADSFGGSYLPEGRDITAGQGDA